MQLEEKARQSGVKTAPGYDDIAKQAYNNAMAPYLAELIHKATTTTDANGKEVVNVEANLTAHAVLGAAVAQASGGAAGEYIAQQLYPGVDRADLSEEQRQTISALAGGLAGDSAGSVVTGAQAGKNTVENNALNVKQNQSRVQEMIQCQGDKFCEGTVTEKYKQISAGQQKRVVECTGAKDCVDKANEVSRLQTEYANRTSELLEKARANSGLSAADQNELSILQVTTIQLEADRNAAIHNALMSGDSPEAKQLAMNSLAQAAGTSAAGIVAGAGKVSKLPASAEKNVVIVDSGKKGAWNKAMNKPEPNTTYKVDGNKTYHTDELSRPSDIKATLELAKNDRNNYQQCKGGKCGNPGDEGGHLIASILGGPGERLNIVPMNGNLNKRAWKAMVNSWTKDLKAGKKVDVQIQPMYSDSNKRPSSFNVTYSVGNGRPTRVNIDNAPGGKSESGR